ncbi:MAG: zinc ABC transporter permease [Chloroflexi bacterium]|nr:MAG: zinc ABC transporter permease [Chloroflexota bacterium]
MSAELTVLLTAIFAASACALVGTFLVVRRMAMMADAISHAILPGLVFAYFLANGPNLVAGVFGASLAGLATVALVEALQRTGRVKSDAAIGIVFPAMFALGTFAVSKWFSNVHLDADAILFGEIAFAPFDRLIIAGRDIGSQPLIVLAVLSLLNLVLVLLFYKEVKLATFDAGLAASLGFSPVLIHYGLMSAVSVTTVGAFAAVGAILVVALMIVPAATAYLLTDRLDLMIVYSVVCGVVSAIAGYYLAIELDVSISGMMAVTMGGLFAVAALFSPSYGIVARARRRAVQRERFSVDLLLLHLGHHPTGDESVAHLAAELDWPRARLQRAIRQAGAAGSVAIVGERVRLTPDGQDAVHAIAQRLSPS